VGKTMRLWRVAEKPMTSVAVTRKRCLVRSLAGIACAAASGVAGAGDPVPAAWAIGLPHGYIVLEHQAQAVDVTDEDVARGFVDVRGGSRIVVTTRSGGRYALDFAAHGTVFRTAQIEGFGRPVALGTRGAAPIEHEAPAGTTTIAVSYRFHLAPGMAPGTYAWPLDIVARRALPQEIVVSGAGSSAAR
jgi:hypothetical protein